MKIKINLPHEKEGFTYALFGQPVVRFRGRTGSVRVPCHILAATKSEELNTPKNYLLFQNIYPDVLPGNIERKMKLYAKELAISFIKSKGWIIESREGEYIKKLNWYGFRFSITEAR